MMKTSSLTIDGHYSIPLTRLKIETWALAVPLLRVSMHGLLRNMVVFDPDLIRIVLVFPLYIIHRNPFLC
jgi:hypothetical protein